MPRTLSAHRRVSTPYPLSSVVSGAVLPPGHKSRSHCPPSALLRHRMRCGPPWRIMLREGGQKAPLNQSCCGVAPRRGWPMPTGLRAHQHRGPVTCLLFDMGKSAAASRLLNAAGHSFLLVRSRLRWVRQVLNSTTRVRDNLEGLALALELSAMGAPVIYVCRKHEADCRPAPPD